MTTTSNNPVDPSAEDLLDVLDSFPIKKESIIPDTDLQFCREQQKLLYESLDKIKRWYDIFCREAEQYRDTHCLSYTDSGILNSKSHCDSPDSIFPDYKKYEFKPFEIINRQVLNRQAAIEAFSKNIIRYFNDKYSISVPALEPDIKELTLDFRPVYTTYVELIEKHLQGRSFKQTAEDEIPSRFQKITAPKTYRNNKAPELTGDKIIFYDIIRFNEFYSSQYKTNWLDDFSSRLLTSFCEGIVWGSSGMLEGNSGIIQDFNNQDVEINRWYALNAGNTREMKFYKNGRIDVHFSDAASAKYCFDKLRLNELNPNK